MTAAYIPTGLVGRAVEAMRRRPDHWWSSGELADELLDVEPRQISALLITPLRHGLVEQRRQPDNVTRCEYRIGTGIPPRSAADDTEGLPVQSWIPAGLAEPVVVPVPVPSASSKPSNPKDAIGVRKAPLSCLPMGVVAEMGAAMLEGASKYGRHNFRAVGVRGSVYFDATMRHLIAWWEGEDVDPDSGLSHVTKALVSLAVLRDAQMQGKCEDDRPPRSAQFYDRLNALAGEIVARHADKAPRHYTIADGEVGE
jgi:hypothetical protein